MQLGAHSISLSVKSLAKSKAFYQTLGFSVVGGSDEYHYLMMRSGDCVIGLFEGMFERNMLTFNPGWDQHANAVDPFDSINSIQQHLLDNGLELTKTLEVNSTGPGSIMLLDPDGNPILIDQHR
ncbi:VOC family protein [Paraferrimonas haliotis]|uniref:VOC domain-containing protein n=1 Tax=Paraferrimonas haliotis TaxID=2013866 RepID=A0AA37TTY3_9GAMM|nr:VOC family protein [Paraferrimonas haliotis]GLS82899.1 hypothetical protein GCM10007894_08760 [Paraferrimonas haliotis]